MTKIDVQLDWREVDKAGIQRFLAKRFFGAWVWPAAAAVSAVTGALVFVLIDLPAGLGMRAAFPVLVALVVFAGLGLRLQRRLTKAVFNAPVRHEPTPITIGPEGVTAPGALLAGRLPWRWVTDVVETETALIILFSPVEFIPILDVVLPEGITRADLIKRIDAWRRDAA